MLVIDLWEELDELLASSDILLAFLTLFRSELDTDCEMAHEVLGGYFVSIHATCFNIVVLLFFFLIVFLGLPL